MAESSQKKDQDVSSEVGIPSGLNRIRTRGVSSKDRLSSKPDELTESRSYAASRPPVKPKQKCVAQRRGKTTDSSKEGFQTPPWMIFFVFFCLFFKLFGCQENVGRIQIFIFLNK